MHGTLFPMMEAMVVGVVIGGLITIGLRWSTLRTSEQEARKREQLAVIVMYAEITAAIDALELTLRDGNSRWVVSMSESRTLSEAWRDHGEALIGLGSQQWGVLSDAVTAVAPSYGLNSPGPRTQTDDLRRSLVERRRLLVEGARILRAAQEAQEED